MIAKSEDKNYAGRIDGFTAHVSFIPEEKIGIVILANKDTTYLPDCIAYHVYDQILSLEPVDWNKQQGKELKKLLEGIDQQEEMEPKPDAVPSHPLYDFIGHVVHPAYENVEITEKNGKLYMEYRSLAFTLIHHDNDIFQAEET
ncbi:DUF3471 domain-containing protein [Bacillus sp. DX1.1]|uniref:DUF3471 domain-containing protein n=1 Tax=unclassified Bacillus (in: firmicutes) TaxID=185979 RepID=UPI002570A7BF|nr:MULTISPECIES: DUF3471 domain-containing protein [unclassified Bacillus (in: firmicutes)]MDM5154916.1 DUF3471 domain-containing protein [Bacillus sp. DX1.1]WJE83785.1 DUF3471 domain-containing protein [Bacillus sp. DX3.1]